MNVGSSLATASHVVGLVEKWAAVALMAIMTGSVAAQVVWRYVLGQPLDWTEELARLTMIWMVFMVVGWALGNRSHIAAGFLIDRLSARTQIWFEIFTTLAIVAFSILLVVFGLQLAILQNVASNTPIGLPRYAFSIQVVVSAIFVIIHAADNLYQDAAKLRQPPMSPKEEAV
ncbi:MAG: TRAP transporter small permease [Chloroflexota bacterium]